MPIPFLNLKAQYLTLKPDIEAAIHQIHETSSYSLGPAVAAFEQSFAAYCGAKHCIGVNSGTGAISLLLKAHGIGPGDEVITVTNSFFASAEGISLIGATPILIDCNESTALLDITKLEQAITPRTKAILAVHLYGQCADIDALRNIAKPHNILVFEDACQAHGATYKGRKAGSLADGAAFSFYPGKNLGAYGEAGAITTNDESIATTIRMLREHGSPKRYHHELVGWNERMDGIQGAVLSIKLKHLDAWNARRKELADRYRSQLPANIQIIQELPHNSSSNHLFVIRTDQRPALQQHLLSRGIQTGTHYPTPIHLQPAYADRNWKEGDFPIAEKLSQEILSLPLYPELTDAQCDEVCDAICSFFNERAATGGKVATIVRSE